MQLTDTAVRNAKPGDLRQHQLAAEPPGVAPLSTCDARATSWAMAAP